MAKQQKNNDEDMYPDYMVDAKVLLSGIVAQTLNTERTRLHREAQTLLLLDIAKSLRVIASPPSE